MSDDRNTRDRQDATLRELMIDFAVRHVQAEREIGTFPEKVRLALADELSADRDRWQRARDQQGDRVIIDLFMSTVWRRHFGVGAGAKSDEEPQADNSNSPTGEPQQDIPGLLTPIYLNGHRLPATLTYEDRTAGRTAMRTVDTGFARVWQKIRATELKRRKADDVITAVEKEEADDQLLLSRANNNLEARLVDHCDELPVDDAAE